MSVRKAAMIGLPHLACVTLVVAVPASWSWWGLLLGAAVLGTPYLLGVRAGRNLDPRFLKYVAGSAVALTLVTYYLGYIHGRLFGRATIAGYDGRAMVLVLAFFVYAPVMGIAAAGLTKSMIERYKPVAGRCVSCGYDLTGNVSGICPECGVVRAWEGQL